MSWIMVAIIDMNEGGSDFEEALSQMINDQMLLKLYDWDSFFW